MRARIGKKIGLALAASAAAVALASPSTRGEDEPSRFGRLFRLGGRSAPPVGKPSEKAKAEPSPLRGGSAPPDGTAPPASLPAYGPSTPPQPAGAGGRIVPQPRNGRAATESDPLVTRVSIGRADDGKPFCMFLQVYADGTVLDSEGVHRVEADSLRPIAQLLQSGELTKVRGYCGGPSTDFVEKVQVVVYDRSYGRLRATSFSHSGDPQGCEPAVRKLHEAIDALQMKLAPAPSAGAAPPPLGGPAPRVAPNAPPIGLTPDS